MVTGEDTKRKWVDKTKQEQIEVIRKAHHQAGHMSREKFRHFLTTCSIKWDSKLLKEQLDWYQKNCEGCILKRRRPDKPAAAIPSAYKFNDCVGVDLKIFGDGTIILYVIE